LIGPNLTDVYWIHGNEHTDLYRVITEGVLEKGMTPWGDILSPDERAQLVAYIRLLAGSNPEGAKPPEGERYDTPSA
jgi:cytochrome c oxidase cbb3-type subunit 3